MIDQDTGSDVPTEGMEIEDRLREAYERGKELADLTAENRRLREDRDGAVIAEGNRIAEELSNLRTLDLDVNAGDTDSADPVDWIRGMVTERVGRETDRAEQAEAALSTSSSASRMFPVIGGGQIPWAVAELAYIAYAGLYGKEQSLEKLAQRGGLHSNELDMLLPDWRDRIAPSVNTTRQQTLAEVLAIVDGRIELLNTFGGDELGIYSLRRVRNQLAALTTSPMETADAE